MTDLVLRPTLKFIQAAYVGSILLIAGGFIVQQQYVPQAPWWTPLVLAVFLLWTMARHIRRRALKVTVSSDKLRCETGMLSKSTRTIQLTKLQDVRVDQTLAQRIFGVGSISLETAGEASRLTVADIDRPQEMADEIMKRSGLAAEAPHGV